MKQNTKYFWSEFGVQLSMFKNVQSTQVLMYDSYGVVFIHSVVKGKSTPRYYATGRNKSVEEAELTLPAHHTFEAFCQKMGQNIVSKRQISNLGEFEYTLEGVEGFFYTSNEPGSDVRFYQEKL